MNEDQLLHIVLSTTFVKSDFSRRLGIAREYINQRFFTSGGKKNIKQFLAGGNLSVYDQRVLAEWGDDFFQTFTKENASSLFDSLDREVKNLPVINLYVPMELGSQDVEKVGTWMRKNLDPTVLIELHRDSSTFGGCAIAWEGMYHDYSLHHTLRSKIEPIRKILSEYAK